MGQISQQLAARFAVKDKLTTSQEARTASRLAKEVTDADELVKDGFDPLHAAYVWTQNIISVFVETAIAFDELEPYYQIVAEAQDEYEPIAPPISPLTGSYFTTWAFFDVRFGPDQETIGTCLMDMAMAMGMDEDLLSLTRLFQESRMGIYEHCGQIGGRVRLRELLTDDVYNCHSSSGYLGKQGELWYARRCPPLSDSVDYHVIFTTPYILLNASKADWTAYLRKQLVGASDRRTALHEFMKWGPSPNHWNEFVFQGYHHHSREAIFLAGLPDVKGSLPHASERGQR